MVRIWTRTRRYLATLWLGAVALEFALYEMQKRTDTSWLLLLWLGMLLVPLAATERTFVWLGRDPRKRWKRHDVEEALVAAAAAAADRQGSQ